MSWHLYLLTFRLMSPLHIGFHKIMHLFRTRTYVPAKPFWGTITAKLTRKLNKRDPTDYSKVGEFLKNAMRFGYLYLFDGKEIFIPRYTDDGLKFGNLPQIEFEKKFVSSMISTSIEPYSLTAEEGMLHEVEFISPYEICEENDEPKPVFLKGLLWVSEISEEDLSIQIYKNDFLIINGKIELKFSDLINTLQVGGERKYGFGQLKLEKLEEVKIQDLKHLGFTGRWREDENEIKLELKEDEFIWSHVKYISNLKIKGNIEPVVGRDWSEKGAGRKLESYGLYWSPGSILTEDEIFKITRDFGLWEKAID